MLKIEEFVRRYQGQILGDHQGRDVGQCVSLCQLYQQYVGWPIVYGNAIDWQYRGDGKQYKFIVNRWWTIPRPSDFAIFRTGNYGHIGIVVSAGIKKMRVFNQNWPHGRLTDPATVTEFNYTNPKCVGFLRKI